MLKRMLVGWCLCLPLIVMGQEPVSTGFWSDTAIGGQDTTSYYRTDVSREKRLQEGSKTYSVSWKGAQWHFASEASAKRFTANPEAYVPAYNGHCANALSLGEGLVRTDGRVWEFFGDRLYLFYAERGRQRWLTGDWQQYRTEAEAAWQTILTQP